MMSSQNSQKGALLSGHTSRAIHASLKKVDRTTIDTLLPLILNNDIPEPERRKIATVLQQTIVTSRIHEALATGDYHAAETIIHTKLNETE